MPHINYHPAPGFGDLLPGNFVVPQNPIRDAGTVMVPSVQAANGGATSYIPHLGELMPGMFVVPQNPVRDAMLSPDVTRPIGGAGKPLTEAVSASLGGLSCGSGCGCGGCGNSGMGDLDLSSITNTLTTNYGIGPVQIPLWGWIAGGVAAWMIFMPSGAAYRTERAQLRAKYRGYRRVAGYAGQYA